MMIIRYGGEKEEVSDVKQVQKKIFDKVAMRKVGVFVCQAGTVNDHVRAQPSGSWKPLIKLIMLSTLS